MSLISQSPPAPRKRRKLDPHSHIPDVMGVLLIGLAALLVFSLMSSRSGILGNALGMAFRVLCGKGAWAMPVLLTGMGITVITGGQSVAIKRFAIGVAIIYVTLLGFFAAHDSSGDFFDPARAEASGGYIGAALGGLTTAMLGDARYMVLGAIGAIGIIFCLNTPLKIVFADLKEKRRLAKENRALNRTTKDRNKPIASHLVANLPADEEGAEDQAPTKPKLPVIFNKPKEAGPKPPDFSPIPTKEGYQLPPVTLLAEIPAKPKRTQQEMQKNIETLEGTLEDFGIDANVVEVATGPTVTRYEVQLGPGIRVARITALADNIAMDLAASHVRVEAPIPGKAAIGVEVPNNKPSMVTLREVCDTAEFRDNPSRLWVALGQDVSGVNKFADLTRMPHLLIGGATNSGKSIGLATIITSLLVRNTPKDLRMVMIDPKRVELSLFDNIPHLMCPVIKDVKEAPGVLRAVWREMDRRYDTFANEGVRNIDGWNAKASYQDKLPYIVVVIDELADLMIQAAAEVETSICRLAQLARATGIHLIIATQRPSVDVITGTIKANISSRIAFTVSSQIDSRTILDQKGAEALIGRGDMLFLPIDASKPLRVQGCYVSEKEIDDICTFWRNQESPNFVLQPDEFVADERKESGDFGDEGVDPLWEESVRFVADRKQASTSMLQRRFSIGFQRASRLLDQMEERQIVGPRDGPRPREVLVSPTEVDGLFGATVTYDTGWLGDE